MDYAPWVYLQTEKRIKEVIVYQRSCLILEGLGLTDIPREVFELTHLKELIVLDNLLTSISPEIVKLENLRHLCFFYNEITEIPTEICGLKKLKNLDLSCNKIEKIPPEFRKLSGLNYLDLRFNRIQIEEKIIEQVDKPNLIIDNYFSNL